MKRPARIMCENTKEYFKDATVTLQKMLFLLRNNHGFMVDLTMDMGKYLKGMPIHCLHLIETFTRFFFEDFGSAPRTTYDFHRFLYAIINVSELRSPIELNQRS